MASRHARPAVRHQIGRRAITQLRGKTLLELLGWQEPPVAAQVVGEGRTLRTGDMPGNRVYRFDFALESR
ncbi:hypothetical protein D3C81_1717970 [compost metagenome]